jgi:hypothetical protein
MNGFPKKERFRTKRTARLLPVIELLGSIPQGEMILPNVHTIRLGPRWCSTPGSQGLASLFLSPAVQTVQFAFDPSPDHAAQVSAFFQTLVQRTAKLQSLHAFYQQENGTRILTTSSAMRGLPAGLARLKKLDHLTDLTLDADYCTPQIFNILGTFPNLKNLSLLIYDGIQNFEYSQTQAGMFPILERLTIDTELNVIGAIVTSYLSKSTPTGSALKFISVRLTIPTQIEEQSLLFLKELAPSLEEIKMDGRLLPKDSASRLHLTQFAFCRRLTLLKVESADNCLPYFRKDQFREVMASLRNLRCLRLTRCRYPAYMERHLPSSSEIPTAELSGLDLSFLGLIAAGLPQLENLWITLDVCDTVQVEPDGNDAKFVALSELHLSTPFLNWKMPTFDPEKAVNYITSLLQPRTKFVCDPAIYARKPPPPEVWRPFVAEYNAFIAKFEGQVLDGIKELYPLSR